MTRRHLVRLITWMSIAFVAIVASNQLIKNAPSETAIAQAETTELTVSAAASLQDALNAIQPIYKQEKPNVTTTYNFGSSGALQQQIEQGAPVDIFISAAPKQMNALEEKGLLLEGTRKDLLKNAIVLIVPKDVTDISSFQDLNTNKISRIAIGEPESVPAGEYAKEALTSMDLYNQIEPKFIFAKDVRQVLSYVETGNVDAGLVYTTDAKISDQVKIVATAPENTHSPITYPIAVLKDSQNAQPAQEFVQFLSTNPAKTIFEQYGFTFIPN